MTHFRIVLVVNPLEDVSISLRCRVAGKSPSVCKIPGEISVVAGWGFLVFSPLFHLPYLVDPHNLSKRAFEATSHQPSKHVDV